MLCWRFPASSKRDNEKHDHDCEEKKTDDRQAVLLNHLQRLVNWVGLPHRLGDRLDSGLIGGLSRDGCRTQGGC
jgi:hypothetical protein